MEKKKITILGQEVIIAYNMATQIAFEEISGEPFDVEKVKYTKNMLLLCMACIIANNPDTTINFDQLMADITAHEYGMLSQAVLQSLTEWCKPSIEDKPTEEGNPKNS